MSLDIEPGEAIVDPQSTIMPLTSIRELRENKFDPNAVADFADDLIGQIWDYCGDELDSLPRNVAHGYHAIVESAKKYCDLSDETSGCVMPSMLYGEIEFQLYFNLSGIIDPSWLEVNPLPEQFES